MDITSLERNAIDLAKAGNFGTQALDLNLRLTQTAPSNQGAWTRLARCYMELGQLDSATAALDAALQVNPQNTIARSLQMEVTKRRVGVTAASRPVRAAKPKRTNRGERAPAPAAAFGRAEFAALGQLAPSVAVETLGPRMEALLMSLSDRPFAAKVVETRNRAGHPGSRLYRRNSFYPGAAGHIYAYQHGGRWEPQLSIGLFAAATWGRDALRAGIGFNLTQDGADRDREAGQARVLATFDCFQQLVASTWRDLLADWMGASGGFIQYSDRGPETQLLPNDAIAWMVNCATPAEFGWVFCGRWLFADRAGDAETLADARALTHWIEQTFTDVLPLWTSVYRPSA